MRKLSVAARKMNGCAASDSASLHAPPIFAPRQRKRSNLPRRRPHQNRAHQLRALTQVRPAGRVIISVLAPERAFAQALEQVLRHGLVKARGRVRGLSKDFNVIAVRGPRANKADPDQKAGSDREDHALKAGSDQADLVQKADSGQEDRVPKADFVRGAHVLKAAIVKAAHGQKAGSDQAVRVQKADSVKADLALRADIVREGRVQKADSDQEVLVQRADSVKADLVPRADIVREDRARKADSGLEAQAAVITVIADRARDSARRFSAAKAVRREIAVIAPALQRA